MNGKRGWVLRAAVLPVCCVALIIGILLGRVGASAWPGLTAMALGAAAVLLLPQGRRIAGLAVCALAFGWTLGFWAWHPAVPEEGGYEVSGIVCDEISTGTRGQYRTRITDVKLRANKIPGDAYWSFYGDLPEGLAPGKAVSFTGRVYEPSGAENPGGFDFKTWLLGRGVTYGIYGADGLLISEPGWNLRGGLARLRQTLSDLLIKNMGPHAGGYASAMLLGTKSLIEDDERSAYSRVGVAHLLSVSGYHVGVLVWALNYILKRRSALARLIVPTAVLALYCLLTGMNPPVVRAALLAFFMELAAFRGRKPIGLWQLCAAAIAMLCWRPALAADAGFYLTYGAMIGICAVTPWISRKLKARTRAGKAFLDNAAATAGAQLGVLLPQLYWFHQLPLMGLVLNMTLLMLAKYLLGLCWLALIAAAVPGLGVILGRAAGFLLDGLTGLVMRADRLDFVTLWTPRAGWLTLAGWILLLLALGVDVRWKNKIRAAAGIVGAAVIALSLVAWPFRGIEYTQFSVGNADAAVLRDMDTVTVIDTGEDGRALATWLHQRRLGVDRLILTHLHSDHAGGVRGLLDQRIPVKVLYLPEGAEDVLIDPGMQALIDEIKQNGTEIIRLGRGDAIGLPDGTLEVLWPERGRIRPGQNANMYSLAMRAEIKNTLMLLTGDLDGRYEAYAAVPADILKVAHHGSSASSGEAFLKAVDPAAAIVSSGDAARPSGIREKLPGTEIFDTESQGAVRVRFFDDSYEIETYLVNRFE